MRTTRPHLPDWLAGSGVIAVAMGVMNVSTYAFTILAARLLGPREYGALAAVMGLLLVVNVVALGLQATGARRVSAAPGEVAQIESEILSATYRSAVAIGMLCLLAVPLVTTALRLDSWLTAALLGITVVPLTVMGGQAGLLQGERRWLPLAGIYLMTGLGRVVFGVAALVLEPDALGAMVGVAVGAFAPAVLGWFALRHPARTAGRVEPPEPLAPVPRWAKGGVLREVAHNSHALLAFFALSNVDVVVARSVLGDYQSGLYAGGLILAKAVLFLPQFVVVIAFPAMAEVGATRARHFKGLGMVLAIGAVATAGAWLLAPLAIIFIGGTAYAPLEPLVWGFALVGTLLAMIQLMVYSVVARQNQRAVFVLWAGLVTVLVLAPFVASVSFLLTAVVLVDGCVLAALVALSLRSR